MAGIDKTYFPDKPTQDAIKQGVDNIAAQIENKDAGKVMRSKVFETPGTFTWTIPEGVTEVFLTGCGGGGVVRMVLMGQVVIMDLVVVARVMLNTTPCK